MKIHVLSDLHLEFSDFRPPETDARVVVLAGDIGKGDHGMGWARANFPDQEIVYVAGNHEFYGRERLETLAMLRIEAQKCDVHFLDDEAVEIGGVRFLGSTLWTDFELFGADEKPWCMKDAQDFMNDFRVICEGDKVFSPTDSVRLHQKSLTWLERELQRPFSGKTVVVTHHLPSRQSVVERFQKSALSAAFASNLDHLFGPADLWIHGHTHDSLDYEVMGTRVVCNPRGYVTFNSGPENFDFNPGLTVEI